MVCVLVGAGCKGKPGEFCIGGSDDCGENLVCFEGRCRSPLCVKVEIRRRAALAAQEQELARRREEQLLRRSGATPTCPAEAAPDASPPVAADPPR